MNLLNKIIQNKHLPILIGFTILFIFLSTFYNKALFYPNKYLFDSNADGMKNYYTYAYQIKNDKSFLHTNAVNYPYGEHFAYLDSQPLLTFLIKSISIIFPSITDYSIGIMNLFIMLSIFISLVLIYLIFKEYEINNWFSITAALLIILLSPQFYRLYGHYSLSYMWIIPGTWYAMLMFFKNSSLKTNLIIGCFIFFTFLIHSYLGFIAFSLFFGSSLINILLKRQNNSKYTFIKIAATSILPVILYYIIVSLSDNHVDRTSSPVGLFTYHSTLKTIFLPTEFSHKIFYEWLFPVAKKTIYEFEGTAYVGFFVNISIIITLFLTLYFLIRKKISVITNVFQKDVILLLIVSSLFLIVALQKPIEGLIIWIVEYISPLKQFRALGRFALIYYYLINITIAIILYRWFKHLKQHTKLALILLIPFFFSIIEVYMFHKSFSRNILTSNNPFNKKYIDDETKNILQHLKTEKYQAILPLPFFHFGSDDFVIEPDAQKTRFYSMVIAYHLNNSMLASNTGRTSVKETRQILQILLPEFYQKPFKNELKKEPFLIVHFKGDKLNQREQEILNISETIIETDKLIVNKISFDSLLKYSIEKPLNEYLSVNDSLFFNNGFFVTDTSSNFYYNSFDEFPSPIKHSGNSALQGNKKLYNHLTEFEPGTLKENETYRISFWYYNLGNSRTHNIFVVEETDENQHVSWISSTDPRFSTCVNGNWSLIELDFNVKNNQCTYKIFSIPMKTWQDTFYVDDLLVRPVNVSVFKVFNNNKKGVLYYNNHFIETNIPFAILDSRKEMLVNYFIEQIKKNKEWYEKIKKDAINKNISLAENIRKNAEFMTKETFAKPLDIEDIKIQYYINLIKSDTNWYNSIVNKPENKEKSIEQILIENAKFMLNN